MVDLGAGFGEIDDRRLTYLSVVKSRGDPDGFARIVNSQGAPLVLFLGCFTISLPTLASPPLEGAQFVLFYYLLRYLSPLFQLLVRERT